MDDYSHFPVVYFITKKSDIFAVFKWYRAWAENITRQRIGILHNDKGGEYVSDDLDRYLADAGIRREHSVCDTPQQLGVAKWLNRTLAEGITTALSHSGLTQTWWEDAAAHFLFGKLRLLLSVTNRSLYKLFYGKSPSVDCLQPFGCLVYMHLQKDQHGALLPHVAQCVFIGYPTDYKAWRFWNPVTRKEIISDSAVFCESVFPFRKPGLSAVDRSVDPSPPSEATTPATLATPALEILSVPHPPCNLESMDTVLPHLVLIFSPCLHLHHLSTSLNSPTPPLKLGTSRHTLNTTRPANSFHQSMHPMPATRVPWPRPRKPAVPSRQIMSLYLSLQPL